MHDARMLSHRISDNLLTKKILVEKMKSDPKDCLYCTNNETLHNL